MSILIKNQTKSIINRFYSTTNDLISPILTNRNPRNLEKLRIADKPSGYHLEKPGKCFWHKLKLEISSRHVTASVVHFKNGEVIKASTNEWAIKKQLYRTYDTSAFINIGRVLASRCLESGIIELRNDIKPTTETGKIAQFLTALENGGVVLQEGEQYVASRPWDQNRPEKPWEITE